MEHRRLGRANSDSTFRDVQLISHTTDLKIYMDEFEKGLAFARDLNPTYQRAILYAHSLDRRARGERVAARARPRAQLRRGRAQLALSRVGQ